jgi:hypothetical protein
MTLGPAPILALIVGFAHVCVYAIVRGSAGQRLPWLIVAAFLGAWAGDALAARLAIDPFRIGDFHLIGSSILAWVGIGFVAIVAELAPPPARPDRNRDPESDPKSGEEPPA